jgi:steroid delta-isomerase-like uncharacterized protein
MSTEKNKALIREFYEEFYNRRNLRVIDDLFSEDYVHHLPEVRGYAMDFQEFRKRQLEFSMAFPDCKKDIEDQVAEENKVVTRSIMRGTQSGDLPNIPATEKKVEVRSIVIYRIKDEKIVEGWESYDSLGMMQQLEVVSMMSTLSKSRHERGYFNEQLNQQW